MKLPTVGIFSDLNTQGLEIPLKENAVSLWENNNYLALEPYLYFFSQVGLGSPATLFYRVVLYSCVCVFFFFSHLVKATKYNIIKLWGQIRKYSSWKRS